MECTGALKEEWVYPRVWASLYHLCPVAAFPTPLSVTSWPFPTSRHHWLFPVHVLPFSDPNCSPASLSPWTFWRELSVSVLFWVILKVLKTHLEILSHTKAGRRKYTQHLTTKCIETFLFLLLVLWRRNFQLAVISQPSLCLQGNVCKMRKSNPQIVSKCDATLWILNLKINEVGTMFHFGDI